MSEETIYLVINALREVRAAKRPRIQADEVAIAITLKFPDTWGSVIDHIAFEVPDFAPERIAGPDA